MADLTNLLSGIATREGPLPLWGRRFDARRDQAIYFAGDPQDAVYVLLSGEVWSDVGDEKPSPILYYRAPAVFGDRDVLAGSVARETVRAWTPAELLSLPADEFLQLWRADPEAQRKLTLDLIVRYSRTTAMLSLQRLPLGRRIAALLLALHPAGDDVPIELDLLAGLSGTSSKSVQRALARLEMDGWIKSISAGRIELVRRTLAEAGVPELPSPFHSFEAGLVAK